MRRSTTILGAIGLVLVALAVIWLLAAPGQLVKYPNDMNKTAVASGTLTLYVDPATGAPSATPQTLPLKIQRNLRVVSTSGSNATVQETSVEKIGPLAPQQVLQGYVIDRGSLDNVDAPQSYAYTRDNQVDRSGAYSINFPFGMGSGPYQLWKNEAGRSYAFRQSGDEIERDGLTLKPMTGRLVNAPASAAYVEALAPQGIRKQMTLAQLAPQLKAQGVDPALLTEKLLPALSGADRSALAAMLSAPVPLKYLVSVNTRLLVEPTTGAIVSLDRIDQTLTVTPDLSRLAGLGTMLSKPQYAQNTVVQGTLTALKGLSGSEPVRVFSLRYGQTPASVADIAAYTQDKADGIKLVEKTIPMTLALLGAAALLAAALVETTTRRRTPVAA